MISVARWVTAILLLAWSSLAIAPAWSLPSWMFSVGAKEYGHWLALVSLLPLIGISRSHRHTIRLLAISLLSTALFFSTAVRAAFFARNLPQQLRMAFGPVEAGRLLSPIPFSFPQLWIGHSGQPVTVEKQVYAKREGKPLSLRFFPSPKAKAPCIVILHTGGWNRGTSDEFTPFSQLLARNGYAVAAIEYRLAPDSIWPAQRDDTLEAIRYLKSHAAELSIDPTRLILLGRSAGGQIAEAVAYTANDPAIRGCIAFYAPADMSYAYQFGREDDMLKSPLLLRQFLGGSPAQASANYDSASSIRYAGRQSPPTLLLHGAPDPLVWVRQSERLDRRLAEAGVAHYFVRVPWGTHAFDFNLNGPGGQISTYAVGYFLAAVLK